MGEYLIDAFRDSKKIILWKKEGAKNIFEERAFRASFYCENSAAASFALKKMGLNHYSCYKRNFMGTEKKVFHAFIEDIDNYERYIQGFERITNYNAIMYNADISPEQQLIHSMGIMPFSLIGGEGDEDPQMKTTEISLETDDDVQKAFDCKITRAEYNNRAFEGDEKNILNKLKEQFIDDDPDIITMQRAYLYFPYLMKRFWENRIEFEPNRIGKYDYEFKEGKSWHSYGMVSFKDRPVRLKGRLLLDTNTPIGRSCEVSGIMEMCRLSSGRFQNISSRSFGFVFQSSITRTLIEKGMLVPYKEKPVDRPMTVHEFAKSDRYGHRYDPKPGLYTNVIEIDFASMYPWIIYNYNISADTLLSQKSPLRKVPGTGITISDCSKGIIPLSIKSFLDKRMECKRNPTTINNKRSDALKAVLVSSYGYLRFREFKLGLGSAHMAIGAYSRELLLETAIESEKRGYRVINGVVDSLYLQYDMRCEKTLQDLLSCVSQRTKIPLELKSYYKWMVMLPSINDMRRRVCTRYYGLDEKGEFKARGIMLRRKGFPLYARLFQQTLLEKLREIEDENGMRYIMPACMKMIRKWKEGIRSAKKEHLIFTVIIGKEEYSKNIPQKQVLAYYRKKGLMIRPGQQASYIRTEKGAVVPEEYKGNVDIEHYASLLVSAAYELFQPFGADKKELWEYTRKERQARIMEYEPLPPGFEPGSGPPQGPMISDYTMGAYPKSR
jgi:DNA polymerase elongation subunit (family B)